MRAPREARVADEWVWGAAVVTTLISRLIREDTIHEQIRTDDGKVILRTFIREADLDHEQTAEEAGKWCDMVTSCGGSVRRGLSGWAEKVRT